jgi:hypothetical protein
MRTVVCVLSALTLTVGCATSFTGEAHVEGGPAGCAEKCQKWGQELVGMVAMGEYSDACICRVPGKNVSLAEGATVAGGASGVWMQTMALRHTH